MKNNRKPVRKCGKCPLNQGDFCWGFACPRDRWRRGRCPAFENEDAYGLFQSWQQDPPAKTRRQIRQEMFPGWKRIPFTGNLEGRKGSEWRRAVRAACPDCRQRSRTSSERRKFPGDGGKG